jgi:hypothetical protein
VSPYPHQPVAYSFLPEREHELLTKALRVWRLLCTERYELSPREVWDAQCQHERIAMGIE